MVKYTEEQNKILIEAYNALTQFEKGEITFIEFRKQLDILSAKENKDPRYQERYLQSPTSLIKSLLFWETVDSVNFKVRHYEYQKRLSELNLEMNPSIKHKASFILEYFSRPYYESEKIRCLVEWFYKNKDSLNIFELSSFTELCSKNIRLFSRKELSLDPNSEASKIIENLNQLIVLKSDGALFPEWLIAIRYKIFSYFHNHPVQISIEDLIIVKKVFELINPSFKKYKKPCCWYFNNLKIESRTEISLLYIINALLDTLFSGIQTCFVLEQGKDNKNRTIIDNLDIRTATYSELLDCIKKSNKRFILAKLFLPDDFNEIIEKMNEFEAVE